MAAEMLNREDIRTRLHNTVCMYRGKPVYITVDNILDNSQLHIVNSYPLGSMRNAPDKIDYRDDEFSNASPPLGYMYYSGNAYYLSRVAVRQFQLGVSANNIRDEKGQMFDRGSLLSKEFEQCVTGNHVTLKRAVDLLEEGSYVTSVPIHRHYAVFKSGRKGLMLHSRGEPVAISPTMNKPVWTFLGAPSVADVHRRIAEKEKVKI